MAEGDSLFVPNVVTPVSMVDAYHALAKAWPEARRRSLLVLVGQIDVETAGGARIYNWNLGNVRPTAGQLRTYFPSAFEMLDEVPPDAVKATQSLDGKWKCDFVPPHPATRFRAFRSLDEGVAEHLVTLRGRFKAAWPAVVAGDALQFAVILKRQRFYTGPESGYASEMVRRMILIESKLNGVNLSTQVRVSRALEQLGYRTGATFIRAVKAFQKDVALDVDGLVGCDTRKAIADAMRERGLLVK